jgi:hypothetical protein
MAFQRAVKFVMHRIKPRLQPRYEIIVHTALDFVSTDATS